MSDHAESEVTLNPAEEPDEPIDPETVGMLLDEVRNRIAAAAAEVRRAASGGDPDGTAVWEWRWRSWQRLDVLLRSQVEWH